MENDNFVVSTIDYMIQVTKMGNYKEAGRIPTGASTVAYELKDKTGVFVFDTLWDIFYKWQLLLRKTKFLEKEKGDFVIHFLNELDNLKETLLEKNTEKLFENLINLNYYIADQQHSLPAQRNMIEKDA